jgi:hypothetical protein
VDPVAAGGPGPRRRRPPAPLTRPPPTSVRRWAAVRWPLHHERARLRSRQPLLARCLPAGPESEHAGRCWMGSRGAAGCVSAHGALLGVCMTPGAAGCVCVTPGAAGCVCDTGRC